MKKGHGDVTMNDSWPAKHMFTYFGPFGVFQADFSLFLDILGQAKNDPKMSRICKKIYLPLLDIHH